MAFTIDQVPKEVHDLWMMKWGMELAPFGVSSSTIEKYNTEHEMLKKVYPEWFTDDGKEIFPKQNP